MRNLLILSVILFLLTSCAISQQTKQTTHSWIDVAVVEDKEIHIDTTQIEYKDGFCYAWIKTIYTTNNSKDQYVGDIKQSYINAQNLSTKDIDKRMKRWDGFTYNITYRKYDCSNKRYMTLEVTDFNSKGEKIISTKSTKSKWFDIGADSVSDYAIYFICDYGN